MPKTKCAIVALLAVASLVICGVAQATPATPTITATQSGALKAQLSSSTGTHWAWSVPGATGAIGATNPVTVTFPAAGTYTATVDATDDDLLNPAPASSSATFHVYDKPTASFTYTDLGNGQVQFTDASTGEPTEWVWTFPSGKVKTQATAPQTLPAGTTSVTLKVTNPAGNSTVTLPVTVNGPPVAVLNIMSTPAAINAPVLLDASHSTDPNQDALSYSWDLNGDQLYGDATGPLQSVSFPAAGSFRVGVQVSDGHGGVATTSAFITVMADRPPLVDFTNSPAQPAVGTQVTFTANSSDPDGHITRIDWDLDNDGQFDDAAGPTATWTFWKAGWPIVAVRATDDQGVATVAFRTLTVTAGLPTPVPTTSVTGQSTGTSTPSTPSSAPGSIPQAPAPSSTRSLLITPFPVVRIRGLTYRGSVRISLLKVEAPPGATIRVRCRGRSCTAKQQHGDLRVKVARKPVRLRSLERRSLRPGTIIEVFVTAPKRIGKYTRFRVRPDAAPARTDLCLQPGRQVPTACPAA
jgi:PKD repeat protein